VVVLDFVSDSTNHRDDVQVLNAPHVVNDIGADGSISTHLGGGGIKVDFSNKVLTSSDVNVGAFEVGDCSHLDVAWADCDEQGVTRVIDDLDDSVSIVSTCNVFLRGVLFYRDSKNVRNGS
jgi:hypothetical protein